MAQPTNVSARPSVDAVVLYHIEKLKRIRAARPGPFLWTTALRDSQRYLVHPGHDPDDALAAQVMPAIQYRRRFHITIPEVS